MLWVRAREGDGNREERKEDLELGLGAAEGERGVGRGDVGKSEGRGRGGDEAMDSMGSNVSSPLPFISKVWFAPACMSAAWHWSNSA